MERFVCSRKVEQRRQILRKLELNRKKAEERINQESYQN